jgi:hypothetical protein
MANKKSRITNRQAKISHKKRLSDWSMIIRKRDHEKYYQLFSEEFRKRYGTQATDNFLGGNAMRFLGFNEPLDKENNNKRLKAYYAKHAFEPKWFKEIHKM